MDIAPWWLKLKASSREWLIENNGDVVPAQLAEMTNAAGSVAADACWVANSGPSGFHLPDEAVDGIETVGNGESPEPR